MHSVYGNFNNKIMKGTLRLYYIPRACQKRGNK